MGEARSRGDAAKGGQGEAERVAEDSEKILEVGGALRLRVEARSQRIEVGRRRSEERKRTEDSRRMTEGR